MNFLVIFVYESLSDVVLIFQQCCHSVSLSPFFLLGRRVESHLILHKRSASRTSRPCAVVFGFLPSVPFVLKWLFHARAFRLKDKQPYLGDLKANCTAETPKKKKNPQRWLFGALRAGHRYEFAIAAPPRLCIYGKRCLFSLPVSKWIGCIKPFIVSPTDALLLLYSSSSYCSCSRASGICWERNLTHSWYSSHLASLLLVPQEQQQQQLHQRQGVWGGGVGASWARRSPWLNCAEASGAGGALWVTSSVWVAPRRRSREAAESRRPKSARRHKSSATLLHFPPLSSPPMGWRKAGHWLMIYVFISLSENSTIKLTTNVWNRPCVEKFGFDPVFECRNRPAIPAFIALASPNIF